MVQQSFWTWFVMNRIEVLVEGPADVPVMEEILTRGFNLSHSQFRIHPHGGRGELPASHRLLAPPKPQHQRLLLNSLPSKLLAYANWLEKKDFVLVVVDADDVPCHRLLEQLQTMLEKLPQQPRVLFRIAIEETESWFIADTPAIKKAYPKANVASLKKIKPDAICGAWEKLQEAIQAEGRDKTAWAQAIAPHLNLNTPPSPSLKKLIEGIERELHRTP